MTDDWSEETSMTPRLWLVTGFVTVHGFRVHDSNEMIDSVQVRERLFPIL